MPELTILTGHREPTAAQRAALDRALALGELLPDEANASVSIAGTPGRL